MPESEVGKSYNTNNTITHGKLAEMLKSIDDLRLYVFADSSTGSLVPWSTLSEITQGISFDLSGDSPSTKANIEKILEEEICQ